MRYGEIQIIGEQVFFDKVAVADLRSDALHGLKEDFKAKILKADDIIQKSEKRDDYDTGYAEGRESGRDEGYEEGYSDALANKPLDGK